MIPYVDPNVRFITIEGMYRLHLQELNLLKGALVVQSGEIPLVVIVPYDTFLAMQDERADEEFVLSETGMAVAEKLRQEGMQ